MRNCQYEASIKLTMTMPENFRAKTETEAFRPAVSMFQRFNTHPVRIVPHIPIDGGTIVFANFFPN